MAEVKIMLYKSITVNTKKLGRLTFSTLNCDAASKTDKSISSPTTDRDAFLHILHRLMKEPKMALANLASLPDRTLKHIGTELLTKSLMIDRYERLKRGKGNFFSKFRRLLEERTENKKTFLKKVVGMVGAGALASFGSEKNLMDGMTKLLSSPWQSFLDEEKKKQEMFDQFSKPPWRGHEYLSKDLGKSAHEILADSLGNNFANDATKTVAERMAESFGTPSLDSLYSAMSKEGYNHYGGEFVGEIERLKKRAEEVNGWLEPSRSILEDIKSRQAEYERVHEFYKPLAERVTTSLSSFYATPALEAAMKAETTLHKTMIAPELWPVKIQDFTTVIGGFQEAINASRGIVSDIEQRLSTLNSDQVIGYKAVWNNVNFPNFAISAVGVLDDYIHTIEEEVDDGSLDDAKTILEGMRNWRMSLPQLSEKAVMGCAMATSDFALTVFLINDGLKTGTLTPETGSLMIMALYFRLVYVIYDIVKKN